jgi:hypothetical protein
MAKHKEDNVVMRIRRKAEAESRRRFSPLLWVASMSGAAVLALGVTGTLSAFVAQITNSTNQVETAGPNTFGLSEALVTGAGVQPVCQTAGPGENLTCASINKYGTNGAAASGTPMEPGGSQSTTVQLQNTASATPPGRPGTLTLNASPCTQLPAANGTTVADVCATITVTVNCTVTDPSGTASDGPVNLTAFNTGGTFSIGTVNPQATVNCIFTTALPAGATGTTFQGVTVTQPLISQ